MPFLRSARPSIVRAGLAAAVAVLLLATASPVQAESAVVIATGPRGKTYHDVYGANLRSLLTAFRAKVRVTTGSSENLELLADGKADIGFAQMDVYRHRIREDGARFGDIGVVGRLTDECLYVAFRREGAVTDPGGLQKRVGDRKPLLAVGEATSGSHETWLIVAGLVPAYGETALRFTDGTLAINHLSAGLLDAVAWVTDPTNTEHKLLRATQADDGLGIMGIQDPPLVAGGDRYTARTVTLPRTKGLRAPTIDTICTQSIIFTRPGIRDRVAQRVSDVLSLEREKLFGER